MKNKNLHKYSHEEAMQSSVEYFKGDRLAASVWVNKYALKDSDGNIFEKNPDEMHRRLAVEIFRIEKKYPNPLSEDEIYQLLKNFKYIILGAGPSGLTFANRLLELGETSFIVLEKEKEAVRLIYVPLARFSVPSESALVNAAEATEGEL